MQRITPFLWYDAQAEEAAKFYVSIFPGILGKLLSDKDAKKAKRVMEAMLKMKKIDIAALKAAASNKNEERS